MVVLCYSYQHDIFPVNNGRAHVYIDTCLSFASHFPFLASLTHSHLRDAISRVKF